MTFERSHQTILFVYAEEANPHYKSRVARLLESINTDATIKVDVVTVMPDGKIYPGNPFNVQVSEEDLINPSGHTPAEVAKEFGYNLVLQSSPSTLVPEMLAHVADEEEAPKGPIDPMDPPVPPTMN